MRVLIVLAASLGVLIAGLAIFVAIDSRGTPETAGEIVGVAVPGEWTAARSAAQQQAARAIGVDPQRHILFGDLHVHSTFSMDAFLWSLPMMNGEGLHPPADACDYARYCSNLDFYSLTDHAEALTPAHWTMIKDSVRQCNARTVPENPDLVAFLGWEWTQIGDTPADHYGHRNVVVLDQEEDKVPTRPIGAGGLPTRQMRQRQLSPLQEKIGPYITDAQHRESQQSMFRKQAELRAQPFCDPQLSGTDLPPDCIETALTPADLWRQLSVWPTEILAIPHGTTWGYYTPPGVKWDKQLSREQHNPDYQPMIEVFSGHGNSEEYRDWRAVEYAADGTASCPAPSPGYLPCCHRAGELIRARCAEPGSASCDARVEKAQTDYLDASVGGRLVVPGATAADWLGCGQCPDCYLPALNYRPGNSVQYIMALSNFDELDADGRPQRFRFGFIASSDNHSAQPGTGYKEVGRHKHTDTSGPANEDVWKYFASVAERKGRGVDSIPFDRDSGRFNLFQYGESERLGSYFYTGGFVAVHSPSRSRQSIWDGFKRREVYGTSGERILLWFDLLNAAQGRLPMGAETSMAAEPRFRVRAVGALEQLPGCPAHSVNALGAERLDYMCGGECYNPGTQRKRIERIEVVRIRPQMREGEKIGDLIDDPWRVFKCADGVDGCSVEFSDPGFADARRDAVYYVRALQAPSPTINAAQLRCTTTYDGTCVEVNPCYGDERTALGDECLASKAERAWSSPIFVNFASP